MGDAAGGGVTIARHVRVSGRVQGVFFRGWTADQAQALGLGGWVRNLPDGSVEALVEGDATAVARLIDLMRGGPPAARVDDLTVEPATPSGAAGFTVRR
jgi:acylphosphatase